MKQRVNTTLHPDVRVTFRCSQSLFEHLAAIRQVSRRSDAEMDAWHSQQALERALGNRARVGRVREGRVDTGDPVAKIEQPTRLDLASLEGQNFRLVSVHGYWDTKKYGRGRKAREVRIFVVKATFAAEADDMPALSQNDEVRTVVECLAAVSAWNNCWVWDNFESTEIVFAGSVKCPQKILAAEGRSLVIKDTDKSEQEGKNVPA